MRFILTGTFVFALTIFYQAFACNRTDSRFTFKKTCQNHTKPLCLWNHWNSRCNLDSATEDDLILNLLGFESTYQVTYENIENIVLDSINEFLNNFHFIVSDIDQWKTFLTNNPSFPQNIILLIRQLYHISCCAKVILCLSTLVLTILHSHSLVTLA